MLSGSGVSGKSVIITGAGQGIGFDLARYLLKRGARITMAEYNADTASKAEATLKGEGGDVVCVVADVRDRAAVDTVVEEAIGAFGTIDAIINNAQNSYAGLPFEAHEEEHLRQSMETGAFGSIRLMQAVFPFMKAAGGGSIVNVVSSTAVQGFPGGLAYVASKGALMAITRAAAREWGQYGIRVNAYAPSAHSPATEKFAARDPDQYKAILAGIPLGRLGDPLEDIASAVAFLVSDDSHFMTGQVFAIDGGQYISPI